MTPKRSLNHKAKFFVVQFSDLKENTPEEKELLRSMYFQIANRSFEADDTTGGGGR